MVFAYQKTESKKEKSLIKTGKKKEKAERERERESDGHRKKKEEIKEKQKRKSWCLSHFLCFLPLLFSALFCFLLLSFLLFGLRNSPQMKKEFELHDSKGAERKH